MALGANNDKKRIVIHLQVFTSHIIRDLKRCLPSIPKSLRPPVSIGPHRGSKVTPLHLFISTSFRKQFRIRWHSERSVPEKLFVFVQLFYLEREACHFKRG